MRKRALEVLYHPETAYYDKRRTDGKHFLLTYLDPKDAADRIIHVHEDSVKFVVKPREPSVIIDNLEYKRAVATFKTSGGEEKYNEAFEELFVQALQFFEAALGPGHYLRSSVRDGLLEPRCRLAWTNRINPAGVVDDSEYIPLHSPRLAAKVLEHNLRRQEK